MEQFNPGEKYRVLITSNSMDEHVVLDFTISTLSKSYSGMFLSYWQLTWIQSNSISSRVRPPLSRCLHKQIDSKIICAKEGKRPS